MALSPSFASFTTPNTFLTIPLLATYVPQLKSQHDEGNQGGPIFGGPLSTPFSFPTLSSLFHDHSKADTSTVFVGLPSMPTSILAPEEPHDGYSPERNGEEDIDEAGTHELVPSASFQNPKGTLESKWTWAGNWRGLCTWALFLYGVSSALALLLMYSKGYIDCMGNWRNRRIILWHGTTNRSFLAAIHNIEQRPTRPRTHTETSIDIMGFGDRRPGVDTSRALPPLPESAEQDRERVRLQIEAEYAAEIARMRQREQLTRDLRRMGYL